MAKAYKLNAGTICECEGRQLYKSALEDVRICTEHDTLRVILATGEVYPIEEMAYDWHEPDKTIIKWRNG